MKYHRVSVIRFYRRKCERGKQEIVFCANTELFVKHYISIIFPCEHVFGVRKMAFWCSQSIIPQSSFYHLSYTKKTYRETYNLKSLVLMFYDITKPTAPTMPTFGKGTECIKSCSRRFQMTLGNPLFWCFSLYLAHTSAIMNFHFKTSFEGFL